MNVYFVILAALGLESFTDTAEERERKHTKRRREKTPDAHGRGTRYETRMFCDEHTQNASGEGKSAPFHRLNPNATQDGKRET